MKDAFKYDKNQTVDEDALLVAYDRGTLRMDDVTTKLYFVDPARYNEATDLRHMGIDYESMIREVIDPLYSIENYLHGGSVNAVGYINARSAFNFSNDYYGEFKKQIEDNGCRRDALEIAEVYAIRRNVEYRFPYFFDPISTRVRVVGIVGTRYFLSENGYVCNSHDYLYETEQLKMRRKYIII